MMDRACRQCGTTKPLTDFNIHKTSVGGRRWVCKVCRSKERAACRANPEARQKERKLRSQWYEQGGREIVRKHTENFRRRTGYPGWSDPVAQRARNLTQAAIRRGRIQRKPCECCGGETQVEAHHDDYTQPLVVRWLCNQCHRDWHMKHEPIRALPLGEGK